MSRASHIGIAILAFALAADFAAVRSAMAQQLDIRWTDDRMSADVGSVAVADVLEAVKGATGAGLKTTGELGKISAQSFEDIPLEAALRRLVGDNSFLVRYGPASAGEAGREVRFIYVYARSTPKPPRAGRSRQTQSSEVVTKEDVAARAKRVRELTQQGDDAAVDELRRLLGTEAETSARRQIVGALVAIGTPRAADGLGQALSDAEPAIRRSAAQGLWNLEGAAAAERLRAALVTEQDEQVRALFDQLLARAQATSAR